MNFEEIVNEINALEKQIVLIYAFNSIGKTRLSVAYKEATRSSKNNSLTGSYYNAFSEDIFVWDNEIIRLTVKKSSLNSLHSALSEEAVRNKLVPYKVEYDFRFTMRENVEEGIDFISFFVDDDEGASIKISRGEERIFVWCFFLAVFSVGSEEGKQSKYFFIDDPVSSLDDHNIFITSATIYDLIEKQYKDRKIIITTHHIGFYSILSNWLTKGEESQRYKKITKTVILNKNNDVLSLESHEGSVFLYHLHLLKILNKASREALFTYHFALLRQVLENIASFLGTGQFSYVLRQIGIEDENEISRIINSLSHQKVYYYQIEKMNPDNERTFKEIFGKLKNKYQFALH